MRYGSLILEKKDYVYLKRILNISGYAGDFETQKSLRKLTDELKEAQIVNNEDMPNDVVRFNSQITLALDNGMERTLQLVIPSDRDIKNSKISILTPMGAALMGYSQGDTVTWDFPGGTKEFKIVKVTQQLAPREVNFVDSI
jgi:regulator of nucleoside diphosphate kinase